MAANIPTSDQLDQAQSLLSTNVDTSQLDGLLSSVGAGGALDGVKGQLAAQQSSLGGQLAQAQMAKGYFDELKANKASKEDKDKYTGSSILKKLAFTAIKAVQVYIVLQITNQAGGIYEVTGQFVFYIPILIYVSFAAQLIDLILIVAPKYGAQLLHELHADFLLQSIGTANVMVSTALIQCVTVPNWGASGYIVEFLQTLVQYQVMLGNFDSGIMAVFNPMPNWMVALIDWLESLPQILWDKICYFFSALYDAITGSISWIDFAKDLFGIATSADSRAAKIHKEVDKVFVSHIIDSHVESIKFKFFNPVAKGTDKYDAPVEYGSRSILAIQADPWDVNEGESIRTIRYIEDSSKLIAIQFVLNTGRASEVYGNFAENTTFQTYNAPMTSCGIVGLKFSGQLGKLVGVELVGRDGKTSTVTLKASKDTELTALNGKPKRSGYCCV